MSGARSTRSKNAFDALLDDLAVSSVKRRQRLAAKPAPRGGRHPGTGVTMAKALSALAALTSISTRAYKSPLIIMKTSPSAGLIMAKALDALRGDRLNADQRGRLMLAVANVDPTPIRQAGRNAIAQLGAVERQLAAGATASHLEAATVLVRSAQAILASGKMTAGDHAALSLALNMLREKIEGGVHAR